MTSLHALPTINEQNELDGIALAQDSVVDAEPTFATSHGAFSASWPAATYVRIDVDRFDDRRDELSAEVVVHSTVPGLARQIAQRRLPLLGTRSVPDLAKYLGGRTSGRKIDWSALLDETFTRAVQAHRQGEPAIRLDQRQKLADQELYALPPAALLRELTIVYGKPGEGKTWWGLAIACALQAGRSDILGLRPARSMNVLVLDWEDDEHVKGKRADMIAPPGVALTYLACRRAIWDELDRILTTIRDHEIEFLLIDSVGMACGGLPPESSEAALRFGLAYRQLGLGAVAIAHLPKATQDDSMPYGSVFWQAQARLTWLIKREQDLGDNGFTIGAFCRKINNDRPPLPLAYDVTFADGQVRFTRRDVGSVTEFSAQLPVRWRIQEALKEGPGTITHIASETGADNDTVSKTLRRHEGKYFVRASNAQGVQVWANLRRDDLPHSA